MSDRDDELGTGDIERHPNRPLIHFGSPAGSRYHDDKPSAKPQLPPMYRLTGADGVRRQTGR